MTTVKATTVTLAAAQLPVVSTRDLAPAMGTQDALALRLYVGQSSKVEVVHASLLDAEQIRAAPGPGEWFWRWRSLPDRPGKLYRFASPASAAEDGIAEESRWAAYLKLRGMTDAQWAAWRIGDPAEGRR